MYRFFSDCLQTKRMVFAQDGSKQKSSTFPYSRLLSVANGADSYNPIA